MEQQTHAIPAFDKLMKLLQPELQKVENIRKRKRLKIGMVALCCFLITGIVSYISHTFFSGDILGFPVILVFILGICIISLCIWLHSASIKEEYKFNIIAPFVQHIVEEGIYIPSQGISEGEFIRCNLFKLPDRYSCEDMITGKIGETRIAFSEVHAEEEYTVNTSKGGKKTYWKTIFKGFIFVADFPKEFDCSMTIRRRKMFASKKDRVYLEDPEFEKCFNTYCKSQLEARYVLTPSIMRRIMELEKKFKGKNMMLSFRQSEVYIAIADKTDHFEASLWWSVFNTYKLKREYEVIRAFAGIVEDLNLNLRIWNKQ